MNLQDIEGRLDAGNILVAVLLSLGGKHTIEAEKFFEDIKFDKKLVLEYDEENKEFRLSLESGSENKSE